MSDEHSDRPKRRRKIKKSPHQFREHGFTRVEDTTPVPATLECEGCGKSFPPAQFQRYLTVLQQGIVEDAEEGGSANNIETPPRFCDPCATYGPPLENPMAALSQPEIDALAVLAAGGSMRRAAAVLGVHERQLRSYLSGREKHMLRAAYAKLLMQMGVTPERLGRVIVEALDATSPYWNRANERFEFYPDHATRLRSALAAQKILGLETPGELAAREQQPRGASIHFSTNLGDGSTSVVDEGYTVEVRRRATAVLDAAAKTVEDASFTEEDD